MDIHTEKAIEEANARDSLLMKKMLRFAKPYAKQIVWSIVLGALVVLATLAQPYLIKIVIDDRINGVYKPMIRYVADDEQVEPWLKQHESKLERREVEWTDIFTAASRTRCPRNRRSAASGENADHRH